jgi:tripartite-type tricarboxylate transporter receptor subunit TctC
VPRATIQLTLFTLLASALLITGTQAQTYPTKQIRFIVPFPAGGVADLTARLVGQKLGESFGQQILIENRPGASGTLGADAATKAPADGYTLLLTTGDFITTPTLMPAMSFDPMQDLVPVTMLATSPLLLGANAQSPIKSIKDVAERAKANPGSVGFSSPGAGTISHLAGEWIGIEGGFKLLHVPYRGGGPAATGVAGGDVPLGVLTPSVITPYVAAGRVNVIAVLTKERPPFGADWPTIAEAGMPDVEAALWTGLFTPKGTPPDIVARLHTEFARVLRDEMVRQGLNAAGLVPASMSQQDFVERIKRDAERFSLVIKQAGIKKPE